jgi:thioredoxin-dependent peroxiredoxin
MLESVVDSPFIKEGAMAQITLKGKTFHTVGNLPAVGAHAPDFRLVNQNLEDVTLSQFKGKRTLMATVPSLDTSVCSMMTKHLNTIAQKHPTLAILVISADLPFAQQRFCGAEHIRHLTTLSMMRDKEFGKVYGILIKDGPLAGILARAVLVLDEQHRVSYSMLVSEIAQEPDYDALNAFLSRQA